MAVFLGFDTSNYTTSVSVFDSVEGTVSQGKKLLPVAANSVGLRQSDAVFSHIKQLSEVVREALGDTPQNFAAVGASVSPRDVQGSYMPCFLVGQTVAQTIACVMGIPCYEFSHQSGHIAAALYSLGRFDLLEQEFIAFHLSGGTTECLHVRPDPERILSIEQLGKSLDLKAGQAIDRVGVMLGLSFPAGKQMEALARNSDKRYPVKTCIKGIDCSLSGVQNQCEKLILQGERPENVAQHCLSYIYQTLEEMCAAVRDRYPNLPMVFAGGVMSNKMIRSQIEHKFGGLFADPEYSCDNAAGVAVLTAVLHQKS